MKQEARSASHDGLPYPRRWWAIVTVGFAIFMTVAYTSMTNVALPSIARDLNVPASATIWIVNAYQMAIMLTLLPLASVGDIFGYKRVYLAGLGLFGVASFACALSTSLPMLVLACVAQGFGAAGVMSVNMALVRYIHPVQRLGHGIGINAVIIAVSAAAGPTIASSVLALGNWPWLFAVNVPVAAAALAIGSYALPNTPRGSHSFDVTSALLSAVFFGSLIGFIETLGHPVSPLFSAGELVVTLLAGYLLFRRQLTMPLPLLPVDLLRIPIFALSVATSACSFMAQTLALVAIPFQLQRFGYSPVETGLLMTPWPLATAVLAPISGRLSDRYPAGLLGMLGLLTFGAGLAAVALMPEGVAEPDVVWRMALAGAGFGLYQSPNNRTMQASAPRARSGGASGLQSMARLLGQTIGASMTALIFNRLGESGVAAAIWFGAGVAVLAAIISALRLMELPQPQS